MVIKWKIQYPAPKGEDERFAYVYLPEVAWDPERRFPVLYMFDGHNVFFDEDATYGKSWGLSEYLDESDTPLIVAAIECNHDPDWGRIREYAPFDFRAPRMGAIKAQGAETDVNGCCPWWLHRAPSESAEPVWRIVPGWSCLHDG